MVHLVRYKALIMVIALLLPVFSIGIQNTSTHNPSVWIVYDDTPDESITLAVQVFSRQIADTDLVVKEITLSKIEEIPLYSDAIILVGHGQIEGLEVSDTILPWVLVSDILKERKPQMVMLLTCDSPTDLDSKIFGFTGQIDAEAGALLAAWKVLQTISPNIIRPVPVEVISEAQIEMAHPLESYVYFVHGYHGNWTQYFDMVNNMSETINSLYDGIRYFSYYDGYDSVDDAHDASIEEYANHFTVHLLNEHTYGTQIDIVAHSMGGLIARQMLMDYRSNLQSQGILVSRVITLGTPQTGSKLLDSPSALILLQNLLDFIGWDRVDPWVTEILMQETTTSEFMANLNADPMSYSERIEWYTIAGNAPWLEQFYVYDIHEEYSDGLIGISRAHLSFSTQVTISDCNHQTLIEDSLKRSYSYIRDWLAGEIDTDQDGIVDIEELYVFGTDPYDSDTDNDGLSDAAELQEETDPLDPDTDNDNLSDGDEMQEGTDPLDSDTDNDGLLDGDEVNIHFTEPLIWSTDADILSDGQEIAWGYNPHDSNDPINAQSLTYSTWQVNGVTGYVRANHYAAMDYVKVYVKYKNKEQPWLLDRLFLRWNRFNTLL